MRTVHSDFFFVCDLNLICYIIYEWYNEMSTGVENVAVGVVSIEAASHVAV